MSDKLTFKLHALRAVDAILAIFQSTFARQNLGGSNNPFLYVANDPKNSKLWIGDPEAREGYDRNGTRALITVQRGSFQPMDMHLHNRGQGSFSNPAQNFTDLCRTPIYIKCEAGNKTQSETLASMAYQILKFFRTDLMVEFDLHELAVQEVSPPVQIEAATGKPWVCTVSARVDTQEEFQLTELSNDLNKVNIIQEVKKSIASFDSRLNPVLSITPNTVIGPLGEITLNGVISGGNAWPKAITFTWAKVSGPGTVTFGTPNGLMTTANFSVAGSYVVELTATDGTFSLTASATVLQS